MTRGYKVRKAKASDISKSRKIDPTVDRIFENAGNDTDEQKEVETRGLVTIFVPIDHNSDRGDAPIEMSLNGKNYILPRNKYATIPVELAEILQRASKQTSRVPDGSMNRGQGVRTNQSGNYIDSLKEEVNERFKLEIERWD